MNPAIPENQPGMHIHVGHWIIALLVSALLFGLGAAAFVSFKKSVPTKKSTDVVIAIGSSKSLPSAQSGPEPKAKPKPKPKVTQKPTAQPKTKSKPKPKPKPKFKPKPELQSKPKRKTTPTPKSRPQPQTQPQLDAKPKPDLKPQTPAPAAPVLAPPVQSKQRSEKRSEQRSEQRSGETSPPAQNKPLAQPAAPGLSDAERSAYLSRIAQALGRAKQYPDHAQLQGIEGVAALRFEFDANGRVLNKSIEVSSGSLVLDDAALSVVDRAAPFEPPPVGFGDPPHVFRIPISFTLR